MAIEGAMAGTPMVVAVTETSCERGPAQRLILQGEIIHSALHPEHHPDLPFACPPRYYHSV